MVVVVVVVVVVGWYHWSDRTSDRTHYSKRYQNYLLSVFASLAYAHM